MPQRLRFAGAWYDQELCWYWMTTRAYDPVLERFLQPDPSQQEGIFTYAYAGDDPVDYNDKTGMMSCRSNMVDGVCPMAQSTVPTTSVVSSTVQAESAALQSIDAPAAVPLSLGLWQPTLSVPPPPVPSTAQLTQEVQKAYQAVNPDANGGSTNQASPLSGFAALPVLAKTVVKAASTDVASGGNTAKSTFGESATRDALSDLGFEQVGGHMPGTPANAPGIDLVFRKVGDTEFSTNLPANFLLVECKYGCAGLRGAQGTQGWFEDRLVESVGETTAKQIINEGYLGVLAKITPGGTVPIQQLLYKPGIVQVPDEAALEFEAAVMRMAALPYVDRH